MLDRVRIFSLDELNKIFTKNPNLDGCCISIGNPGKNILQAIPKGFTDYLRIEFHDIHEPNEKESKLVEANHIEQVIEFVKKFQKNNLPYYIHCNAGIGRSPAIAMMVLKI